jgi:hypothetical protein
MSIIKLTVNGATITIDQTADGDTTIGVNTQGPTVKTEPDGTHAIPIVDGGYYTPPAQTDSVGPAFSPEQLGKLREVIRAIAYGIIYLGPSDGSVEDRLRRDRKLQEKYHLEKDALNCLCSLVGDTFYCETLKDFKI